MSDNSLKIWKQINDEIFRIGGAGSDCTILFHGEKLPGGQLHEGGAHHVVQSGQLGLVERLCGGKRGAYS